MESEYFDGVDDAEGEHAMQQARERIENHRKGEFTLNLTDEAGKPVVGDLEVTQVDHEFLFGAAMTAALTLRDDERMSAAHERAKEVASELLNIVTVNCHWGPTQPTKDGPHDWSEPDWMIQWAKESGLQRRGHALVYMNQVFTPQWRDEVQSTEEWWECMDRHIQAIADRYRDDYLEWDFLNEIRFHKEFRKSEIPLFPRLDDPANVVRIHEICRKHFPDTRLLPLDSVMLSTHEQNEALQEYLQLTRDIIEAGADFDGIGTQCHFYTDLPSFQDGHSYSWGQHRGAGPDAFCMKEIDKGLDMLTEFGKPVYITEFNPPSRNGWTIKQKPVQAQLTEEEVAAWSGNFYTMAFSKPYVRELSCWFVIDSAGGRGLDAGFVSVDGRLKPLYYTIKKLLKETWMTRWTGSTKGATRLRGFYGTYEIQVSGFQSQTVQLYQKSSRDQHVELRKV